MTQPNPPTGSPPPPPPPPSGGAPLSEEEARNLAAWSHYLNVIWLVPLIIYLMKKGQNAFLEGEAKEALNFALTCFIANIAINILGRAIPLFIIGCVFGLAGLAILIIQIVLGIQGGNQAKQGIAYKYPINLRLIK